MEIYHYQLKKLFQKNGIPILKGQICYTPLEIQKFITSSSSKKWILTKSDETKAVFDDKKTLQKEAVSLLINMAEKGLIPKCYLEEDVSLLSSFSLNFFISFEKEQTLLRFSDAQKQKEYPLLLSSPLPEDLFSKISKDFQISLFDKVKDLLQKLFYIFKMYQLLSLGVSDFGFDTSGNLFVLDGDVQFDENAFIQDLPPLFKEVSSQKQKALHNRFHYFEGTGNVGCLVNGSGMALSTLDMLLKEQLSFASLIDIGPRASSNKISIALKMLLSEGNVEKIFINLLGSITTCDLIAKGIIDSCKEMSLEMPILVRIKGLNAPVGERLLKDSNIPFILESDLEQALLKLEAL
ncbi:MAG: hypothetical protein EOM53_01850 [Alphaproteobacteria bacterium]|nr:hypothetical protein [Alphaproteobacteria bacterium]